MPVNTFARVKKIVVDRLECKPEKVVPTACFVDDLNADSLDLVELIMDLQEAFDVEINDDEAERIKTVQDAVNYINDHAA